MEDTRIACLCGRPPSPAMADKLEQAQARVKRLQAVIEGFLLYLNDSPEQTIIPDGRISDAAAALAEGEG